MVFRGLPDDSVNARSFSSLISNNPFDRQCFCGERVRQQSLQGFYPSPIAFPRSLRDAELKSFNLFFAVFPIDRNLTHERVQRGVNPSLRVITGSPLFKVSSCLLAMKNLLEVGTLSRRVMSLFGSTPIPPITGDPSLFPDSSTHSGIDASCDCLPGIVSGT